MTLDEQLAILQAAKEGKKIKRTPYREGFDAFIVENEGHRFNFNDAFYDIVREPMECWVVIYQIPRGAG